MEGIESDLADMQAMMDKLEEEVIHIAVFGLVGRGKSSLLNALLGRSVFQTGPTHGVTQAAQTASWSMDWETRVIPMSKLDRDQIPPSTRKDPLDHTRSPLSSDHQDPHPPNVLPLTEGVIQPSVQSISVTSWAGSRLELIDTPGLDEVDGEHRAQLACHVARMADLILFVIAGDMTRVEYEALAELREASKPILLVFNKMDQYPEVDRDAIYAKIRNERVREILSPNEIVMVAASPRIPTPFYAADGSLRARLEVGPPDVEALRQKILEVLHREGRSLIALNILLFADRLNQELVQRKLAQRSAAADDLIWIAARTKAVAVAVNPITVVDSIGGAVVDMTLIIKLSQLYGIPMTRVGALQLLQKIVLSMVSLGAGELVAVIGLGSLKTILGSVTPFSAGFSVGAYASVAFTQAALAGVSCYAIGMAAQSYLKHGASWGPEGPKLAIAQILSNLDESSITARIRSELQRQLQNETLS